MFETSDTARVFGLAPGVDFPSALVDGLLTRMAAQPPEALARVQLIVNTTRMQRRLKELFDQGPPRLLPRLNLLTHLDDLDPRVVVPSAVNPLQRRLELVALVARLIDQQRELAPRTSLYALTDSLAGLMDEMQGEGVGVDQISALDVSDQSEHWQRTQKFITIAHDFLNQTSTAPDKESRQRQMVQALAAKWAEAPPQHPVILAGSTGSRGTTLLLMEAVARLPQGALVLPGYDFDMPKSEWAHLADALGTQDHPQYRFGKLMRQLSIGPDNVQHWHVTEPPSPARNALVSLALRPAPVTHAWLSEGPLLKDLGPATRDITLVEAPSPRIEALTIALRLRQAVAEGQKAAVITPDRMLTRQITAALDQWNILPDDSAGAPLHLSPPGRFLRHTAALFHRKLDAEALLTLLKHPLTHSRTKRGPHTLNTQRLEMQIRRDGLPFPDPKGLRRCMDRAVPKGDDRDAALSWAEWVGTVFTGVLEDGEAQLTHWIEQHTALSERIAAGPGGKDSGELWQKKAGQQALAVMESLKAQARHAQPMTAADYAALVGALLSEGEVRDRDAPHPDIMIWGTLEARVQGADLVILAGLNDGTWPEAPDPDPWLNRQLRNDAGLLLPERRIGLAAHDYQQAIAAPEVWITRAIRSEDAETVPSRWLNRLCNLLEGLTSQNGAELLEAMRDRGKHWVSMAAVFEEVENTPPARRPAPRPPESARPRKLNVTDIKHLIRDPYAIYAKYVLRLRKLGPLVQSPDALSRGMVLHDVMESFVRRTVANPDALTADALIAEADRILSQDVPWPAARALWLARMHRIAPWFVSTEITRQDHATPIAFENDAKGELRWPDIDFTLVGRADRIDKNDDGAVLLYDYKTGRVPTAKEQKAFDKQLLIEAAMIEENAFDRIGPAEVLRAVFIGLGSTPTEVAAPLLEEPVPKVLADLRQLIEAYRAQDQGFVARRMMQKESFGSDYDLLSRHGEWDITDDPEPEDLR